MLLGQPDPSIATLDIHLPDQIGQYGQESYEISWFSRAPGIGFKAIVVLLSLTLGCDLYKIGEALAGLTSADQHVSQAHGGATSRADK